MDSVLGESAFYTKQYYYAFNVLSRNSDHVVAGFRTSAGGMHKR